MVAEEGVLVLKHLGFLEAEVVEEQLVLQCPRLAVVVAEVVVAEVVLLTLLRSISISCSEKRVSGRFFGERGSL